MDLKERVELYDSIEQRRGRPLVVYATSTRPNVAGQMAADSVREMIDQIDAIPSRDGIDIMIHSTGGDALAAWKLMSLFREQFTHVAVLVPSTAFSAATLFALGADEIVMHPHASLGPIDPQITVRLPDGTQRNFAYEDVTAFLRFLMEDVKLSEQTSLTTLSDRLLGTVDPLIVGAARRASHLSEEVGARLLMMHMEDAERAKSIAANLNKSFFAHGDAVSRSRAKDLGLKIAGDDNELEGLIWRTFLGLEAHMKLREPFQPTLEVLKDPNAAAQLKPGAPLQIPPNMPQAAVDQIVNAAANAALQKALGSAVEVPYELLNAVIESRRRAAEFRSKGSLTGHRRPDGQLQITGTDKEAGWREVPLPQGSRT